MFTINREKGPWPSPSAVDEMLRRVEDFGHEADDYIWRIRTYLNYAKECNLGSRAVVDSCVDLAETYTDVYEVAEMRRAKRDAWNAARESALMIEREPTEINMELDPIYFEAILRGVKTYEGRAYKPGSDKNYPDMRRNDRIRFRLSNRREDFAEDAACRGLSSDTDMVCTVKEIYFAPTVHGMYQIPKFNGLGFQPMIEGASELIQLQRAAIYHTFPGYHELIGQHGFLGIQVENPQLVDAI